MDAMLILGILGVIALCMVLYKLMEGFSNALLSFNVIIFVLLALSGIFLFVDAKAFSDSFPDKEKILLIDEEGELKGAYIWKGNETREVSIEPYQEKFRRGDYEGLRGRDQIAVVIRSSEKNYISIFGDLRKVALKYKHGDIRIEPSPFIFKIAKIIPDGMLGSENEK